MSKQYPGGLITKSPVTPSGPYSNDTASGIWTLDQQAYWAKLGQWPTAGNNPIDPQFNYVTMLLHGDGTNGAQNNTFLDSSTNNFTITRNGNTTQGSFSPYGSNWSNYFDGSTSYLSVPSSSALAFGTGDFTVELWVNYYSDTGNYVLYDGRGTSILTQIGFVIYLAGGTLYAQQGTTPIVTTTSPTANAWHHIAFSRSGSSNKLFVDGTQVGTTVTDSTNYSTAYSVGIGSTLDSSYTSSYDLNGYLSNVRVVKGTAVYTSNFTPSTTPLTAITNTSLLTCQSNRFVDNSSNAFAITATGTPSVQRFNPFGTSTAYSTSVIGGSGYFDGSGDYLSVAASSAFNFGTGDYTIEGWVYSSSTTWTLYGTGGGGSIDQFVCDGGTLYWGYGDGAPPQYGVPNFFTSSDLSQWVHVAVSRSGTTQRCFKNGVVMNTLTTSSSYGSSTTPPEIGRRNDGSYSTNGYLSNIRVVKGTALYTSAFTPPTAPLTAVSGTSLLTSMTNGAIFDNAMINDLETQGNAQISTSVKKYGTGSLYFDGSGDWMTTVNKPPINLGGDFTVEAWVYQASSGTNSPQISLGSDTFQSGTFLLYINTSQNFGIYVNGSVTFGSTVAAVATWHHIAMVRSGSTITGYLNGTSQFTFTNPVAFSGPIDLGSTFFAGTRYYGNGYIDDLRITKGYARYTSNFTPPTAAFFNYGPT